MEPMSASGLAGQIRVYLDNDATRGSGRSLLADALSILRRHDAEIAEQVTTRTAVLLAENERLREQLRLATIDSTTRGGAR